MALVEGFRDEMEKVGNLRALVRRIKSSPALRRSIMRAALLGGGTGAASGAIDPEGSPLRGALVGSITGGLTGTAFPGWFSRANMRAADEARRSLRRR